MLVSVITAFKNEEPYIYDSLISILDQDYKKIELIVVNDGSSDHSEEIVRLIERRDSRLKYFPQINGDGLTAALIFGIKNAQGVFIARHDAHDISHPARIGKQVEFLEKKENCVLVGTGRSRIDSRGDLIKKERVITNWRAIRNLLPFGNVFTHGSVMFRRESYEHVGGYDRRFRYAQDYELWLRLFKIGELSNLPETLYSWRQTHDGISTRHYLRQGIYAITATLLFSNQVEDEALEKIFDLLNLVTEDGELSRQFVELVSEVDEEHFQKRLITTMLRGGMTALTHEYLKKIKTGYSGILSSMLKYKLIELLIRRSLILRGFF